MPRNPIDRCQGSWEDLYGTTVSGNLPQHVTKDCLSDIIDLNTIHSGGLEWVGLKHFNFYHFKCPYSTEASLHYIRNIDRSSPNYWKLEELNQSELASHTSTSGIMIRYARGVKYGWLCVDPACPYFISTGRRYFYI